jgi:hypothetical protein
MCGHGLGPLYLVLLLAFHTLTPYTSAGFFHHLFFGAFTGHVLTQHTSAVSKCEILGEETIFFGCVHYGILTAEKCPVHFLIISNF